MVFCGVEADIKIKSNLLIPKTLFRQIGDFYFPRG